MKAATMAEKRPVFEGFIKAWDGATVDQGVRTHEHEDTARIFDPFLSYLVILLLGLGKVD